ncbi:Uncharacterised protein [Hungatella hathewayi]|nr:Uncharacterised protein [Hungatella hathewayi]
MSSYVILLNIGTNSQKHCSAVSMDRFKPQEIFLCKKQTDRRTLIIEEVRIEMKHRIVVVPERPLSKEQRRNFKKENPGYKLDFMSRYPSFPLFVSVISLLLVICKPILNDMLLKFIHS